MKWCAESYRFHSADSSCAACMRKDGMAIFAHDHGDEGCTSVFVGSNSIDSGMDGRGGRFGEVLSHVGRLWNI